MRANERTQGRGPAVDGHMQQHGRPAKRGRGCLQRRMWSPRLLVAALALALAPALAGAVPAGAELPSAPAFTDEQLERLSAVDTWDIELSYREAYDAEGSGSSHPLNDSISGWTEKKSERLSYDVELTVDSDAPALSTPPWWARDPKFPEPEPAGVLRLHADEFHLATRVDYDPDRDRFPDACRGHTLSLWDGESSAGRVLLDSSDLAHTARGYFWIDFAGTTTGFPVNPPLAVSTLWAPSPTLRRVIRGKECDGGLTLLHETEHSRTVNAGFAHNAWWEEVDTQVRLENGRFVVRGTHRATEPGFECLGGWGSSACSHSKRAEITYTGVRTRHVSWVVRQHVESDLFLSAVDLEHREFPSGSWVTVPEAGTTDGNVVRITAIVTNRGSDDLTADVVFADGETGDPLSGGTVSREFPAGERVEVEYEWDTSGLAWDGESPRLLQRVEAQIVENGLQVDAKARATAVLPRPVVLVHGLWSDAGTWSGYQALLTSAHPSWEAFAVGDGQAPGIMDTGSLGDPFGVPNTILENAEVLAGYVEGVRDRLDAWHVDLVGHSMGGLISRQYIHSLMPESGDSSPVVGRLVMLGTPNRGTACALLSPFAATYELRPEVVASFNERVGDRGGVAMSVLAGNDVPFTCQDISPGDSVVSIASATTDFADSGLTASWHTDMTGSAADFAGFVRPHLAADVFVRALTSAGVRVLPSRSLTAVVAGEAAGPQLALLDVVEVAGGGTADVAVQVSEASALGVALVAPGSVAVGLRDPAGAERAALEPASTSSPFRSLRVEGPAAGTWTVRLRNDGAESVRVGVSAWLEGSPLVLSLDAGWAGDEAVRVRATLSDAGSPVAGATVAATLAGTDGSRTRIELAESAPGTYVGTATSLAPAGYVVAVTAHGEGFTRATTGSVAPGGDTDETPPVTTATASPAANGHGWNDSEVTVELSAVDEEGGSGVEEIVYATGGGETVVAGDGVTVELTGEGVTRLTYFARDVAGNEEEPRTLTVRIDLTPPEVSAARAPAANLHGWNNEDVTATFEAEDTLSGIDGEAVVSVVFSREAADQSATRTFADLAGNTASATVEDVSIDKTPPEIAGSRSPEANEHGWNNEDVTVRFACEDALSGIDSCGPTPQLVSEEGRSLERAAEARDLAGNTASATVGGINIDKTPPEVSCTATPSVLWPPNHRLVDISVEVTVEDALSGPAGFTLEAASSSEPDDSPGGGDGRTTGDVDGWTPGTPDTAGRLRAERLGGGPGRVYTLEYAGADLAGNLAACAATVTVPHDQRRGGR